MDDCVPRTVVIYEHYVQENPIHASPVKVIRILASLSQPKSNMERSCFFENTKADGTARDCGGRSVMGDTEETTAA